MLSVQWQRLGLFLGEEASRTFVAGFLPFALMGCNICVSAAFKFLPGRRQPCPASAHVDGHRALDHTGVCRRAEPVDGGAAADGLAAGRGVCASRITRPSPNLRRPRDRAPRAVARGEDLVGQAALDVLLPHG